MPKVYRFFVYSMLSLVLYLASNTSVKADISNCFSISSCLAGMNVDNLNASLNSANFIAALIETILPIIITFIGFITVIVIVISGIQFVTSQGNPEAAGAARGRLTFAVIGFALAILAFAITKIIDLIFLSESGVF